MPELVQVAPTANFDPSVYAQLAPAMPCVGGWVVSTLRDVATLMALPDNWDTYGSPRIASAAREAVQQFVRLTKDFDLGCPDVVAIPGGGIGLVFTSAEKELQIEAMPSGELSYLKTVGDEVGDEVNFSPSNSWLAVDLVRWLLSV